MTVSRVTLTGKSSHVFQAIAELRSNIQYDNLQSTMEVETPGDLARRHEQIGYLVIVRGDRMGPRKPGPYVLATRQVFAAAADAKGYAKTCAKSRQPLVVEGRFWALREETTT